MDAAPTDMATQAAGGVAADGRVARGDRTRRALALAMLDLAAEGDLQPSAKRVAERAGVSARLVFHHFDDMESVLRAAIAIQFERHWSGLSPVPPSLALQDRIHVLVGQRAAVYDAITPVRRASRLIEHTSPTVAGELARARRLLRLRLEETFSPELDPLDDDRRAVVADALEVAGSWETWERLRTGPGGTSARAIQVVELLMRAVVAEAPTTSYGPVAVGPVGGGLGRTPVIGRGQP
jgi:TetR/AcrR family transcriptional regulator, regulator of autoinduction and epiphytic fitness